MESERKTDPSMIATISRPMTSKDLKEIDVDVIWDGVEQGESEGDYYY
jgi:hypothetical protein